MKPRVALGLFSGGLDSILACRVVADQGVRVVALKFVTPFFDSHLLADPRGYAEEVRRQYGLEAEVIDVSQGYLRLLTQPAHGFGRHFNPCIDCKILMLTRARELMAAYGASFLVSGEVLGQRPMSQRRDTLRVIERDAGCAGMLLRPLSAKLMEPTLAEQEGLVDRQLLYGFSGRGRRQQKALAAALGIVEYPTPAGGCMLTDPNLAGRIQGFYQGGFVPADSEQAVDDIELLLVGRQFRPAPDLWFIIGRNEAENNRLEALRTAEDWLCRIVDRPGPVGLWRYAARSQRGARDNDEALRWLAGIVVRYGKKVGRRHPAAKVTVDRGADTLHLRAVPLPEPLVDSWRI